MSLLQAESISKSFPGVQALSEVSFDVAAGEVHALVGENGAGKSTLIRVVTGAEQPDSGRLVLGGRTLVGHDPLRARALGIIAIYQQPALFGELSVAENIALATEPARLWRRVDHRARRRRAGELLDRLGARIDPDRLVRGLSMPEQQLVEIARALGAEARILIMDEPTASLAEREVARLFRIIGELRESGVGIVYISHRLDELYAVADRVTVLRDGRTVGTWPLAEVGRAELIRHMVGRELSEVYPQRTAQLGEVVLEARGLSCRAGGLRDVSLQVRAGEIVGLAGLMGAGRTELARALFGLTPVDAGSILIDGRPVRIDSPAKAIRHGLALVPEDRRRHGVIGALSGVDNTTLAVLRRLTRAAFVDRRRELSLAADLFDRLDVRAPSLHTLVGTLSGGNQQKVAVARWLASEPRVILVDEPTQGIDVGAKAEVHRILGELAAEGKAILLISSELTELLGMCDRIVVMSRGAVTGTLDRDEASQELILALALGHRPEEVAGG